jgi:CubicO group peptidase (beta-lactamase class C family)
VKLQAPVMLASVAVAAALITAPVAWRRRPPEPEGHRAEDLLAAADTTLSVEAFRTGDLDQLRALIDRLVRERGGAGVAVALVDTHGTIWSEGFGRAGPDGRPMSADTLFRVGSLTKPFLALGIMRLVEQGRLRLEDPVSTLAPEIGMANRWDRTDPIRVAHLLEHTAGFDEMRFNEIFDPDGSQDRPLREVLAVNPRSRVARWRPGTRFAYSQPGYTVAAYLIEKLSGTRYEQFLEQQVFAPLGVKGASLRLTPEVRSRLATGQQGGRPVDQVMLLHRPAANLMISSSGLSRLLALYLGRGTIGGQRFLQPASIERIETCGTIAGIPQGVGYGLGNWGDVQGPIPMRGHGGFVPGYWGFLRYSPRFGFGFAILTNDVNAGRLVDAVARAIYTHLSGGARPPAPPVAPAPSRPLEQYVGSYRHASPGVEFLRFRSDIYDGVRVVARDGQLWVEGARRGGRLVPTGPDRFRFPRDNDSSVVFGRSAEGRQSLLMKGGYYEQESAWWAMARKAAMELALLLMFSSAFGPALLVACRDRQQVNLVLRPMISGLCLLGTSWAFDRALQNGLLGLATPLTMMVWLLSWGFGITAHHGFVRALPGMRSPLPLGIRIHALLTAAGATWVALHLSRYGLIGIRTWQW